MKSVYFIRTRDNRPYILVTVSAGSTDFQPLSEDADDVAQALDASYQNRAIKENELEAALDDDLKIEGPVTVNRTSREKIADFLEEAQVPKYQSGTKPPVMALKNIYSSDVADMVLDDFPVEMRPNIVEYKAMAFLADQTKTTFNYEVKRVRATWDPTLSIPGTNRRGGWRCPVGTRYGGQITDRFGRNCGWGVARRIANAITNIGERMEDVDDRRRGRRVNRRNERMLGRLQRDAGQGGRVEQGLRGIAERLEGGEAPRREGGGLFGDDSPLRIGPARMPREPREPQRQPQPQRRRTNLRDSEQRRMEREVEQPNAPRTEEPVQPPRQPRRRGQAAEPDATTRELGDAPRQGESYDDYVNRKYSEYQGRVEKIQRDGGQAGLLTRDEWYKFNRSNLREAWGRANGGEIPNEENIVPRPAREPRPRAPRRRRVNASEAQASNTANRRPRPQDQPIPQQRPAARPNRVRPANPVEARQEYIARINQQLEADKRQALRNIPADASAAEKREYRDYVNQFEHQFGRGGNDVIGVLQTFEQWREFNNEVRRANGQRPLGPRAPRQPRQVPAPPEPPLPNNGLGGSIPDARSERNVYNQFRQNGLPDTAYWRAPDFPEGEVRAELERRFGRYYDNNNQRNARGDYVNQMIRRRGEQGAPAGGRQAPPEPPARPAAPQAPAAPPQPPAQPPARPRPPEPPRPVAPARKNPKPRTSMRPQDPNLAAGKADNDAKIGQQGVDGLPGGKRVEVGNLGINTADDAKMHLAGGGDLADVPDDFVYSAIIANAGPGADKRYAILPKLGGAGNSNGQLEQYQEKSTGKKYLVKYNGRRYKFNEDVNEILGNNIAGRLGFKISEFRFAGPTYRDIHGQGRPIIFEHVDNYMSGRISPPVGSPGRRMPVADIVHATVLDYLIVNTDRHGGNYFVADDNGSPRFIPIDPSLGFHARNWDKDTDFADARGFRQWLRSMSGGGRNDLMDNLRTRVSSGELSRDDVIREIRSAQQKLRESQRKLAYKDFAGDVMNAAGKTGEARDGARLVIDHAEKRIKFIIDADAVTLADEILGRAR